MALVSLMIGSRMFRAPVRGYWCDDRTIRYPHLPMVVDYRILLFVSIFLPVIIFKIIPGTANSRLAQLGPKSPSLDYLFGFLVNLLLTCYCKIVLARARPNFYDICKPSVGCDVTEQRFVSQFECTTPYFLAHNSLESFFSGHASTGTYGSLAIVLHLIANWRSSYIFKATISCFILAVGLFPGFTQVLNHWHHWSDVLVGQIVGIVLAVAQYFMRHWLNNVH